MAKRCEGSRTSQYGIDIDARFFALGIEPSNDSFASLDDSLRNGTRTRLEPAQSAQNVVPATAKAAQIERPFLPKEEDGRMLLPHANATVVDKRKVTDYLLNELHPDGAGKARFFVAVGFKAEDWHILAASLHLHARENPVIETVESPYGRR